MIFENKCEYISSRGILKSCDVYSKNPKSSCNNDYSYLINMIKQKQMFDGISIYVCSDLLKFFVNKILPYINHKFVLVSGDSDLCVPIEALNINEINILLSSKYLLKWFAQNTQIQNSEKIIQMPIGLDYHTIGTNPNHKWKLVNENHLPFFQESTLINIKKNSQIFYDRIKKIYVNFSLYNDRFNDRKSALEKIPKDLLDINLDFLPRTNNWIKMSKYAFILSPFGIGMDCHRTWEVLCLGCIPILKAPNFKNLFSELPVIIVNEWNEVTQELLDKTIEDFKTKIFNYDKLKLNFWINQIKKI
jgi:hypothetical protein